MDIYSPVNGGYSSESRLYRGFEITSDVRKYQLRAGRSLHLQLDASDSISVTNTEGRASVWLMPFDAAGNCNPQALGLPGQVELDRPVAELTHEVSQWFVSNGGRKDSIRGYQVFDHNSDAGEQFVVNTALACDLWLVINDNIDLLAAGGRGGWMQVEVKPKGAAISKLPDPIGTIRYETSSLFHALLRWPMNSRPVSMCKSLM